jgi:hypothetical protein
MRTLVVCYSLTANKRTVATALANDLAADRLKTNVEGLSGCNLGRV